MSLTVNDKRVLKLIKVGAENSITGAEISLITKLSERTVPVSYTHLDVYKRQLKSFKSKIELSESLLL